jgi:Mce-associated membrane protein
VEDQQPPASDLTDESPDNGSGDDASVETDSAETEVEQTESEVPEDDSTIDSVADDEIGADAAEDDPGVPAGRSAGRRLVIAVAVAAALFVGATAFAAAMVQPYLADRATVNTKLQIARTAANAITTLWTYTPENMDTLADRSAKYLSGDFEAEYRKFIDAIAAPNKQAKVTNSTEITGAAVESLNGPDATAIVYTNTTSTTPATKEMPSLKYLSYRLVMKRDHARWLVTRMTTITSLDLTPQT